MRDDERGQTALRESSRSLSQDPSGAPSRTRTDTWRILSPLPLPIGLWGRRGRRRFRPATHSPPAARRSVPGARVQPVTPPRRHSRACPPQHRPPASRKTPVLSPHPGSCGGGAPRPRGRVRRTRAGDSAGAEDLTLRCGRRPRPPTRDAGARRGWWARPRPGPGSAGCGATRWASPRPSEAGSPRHSANQPSQQGNSQHPLCDPPSSEA